MWRVWQSSCRSTWSERSSWRKSSFILRLIAPRREQLPHLPRCERTEKPSTTNPRSSANINRRGTKTARALRRSQRFRAAWQAAGSSTSPRTTRRLPGRSRTVHLDPPGTPPSPGSGVRAPSTLVGLTYSTSQVSAGERSVMFSGFLEASASRSRHRISTRAAARSIHCRFRSRIAGMRRRSKPWGITTTNPSRADMTRRTWRARRLTRTVNSGLAPPCLSTAGATDSRGPSFNWS
jgi:hypothetical protein